ncbi:hypothetical protein OF83DRAFT_48767 [Amylostereum chailletii]|nr:hypothetical protein OF83DRAFT_48767 [Amylostereum chailletii]
MFFCRSLQRSTSLWPRLATSTHPRSYKWLSSPSPPSSRYLELQKPSSSVTTLAKQFQKEVWQASLSGVGPDFEKSYIALRDALAYSGIRPAEDIQADIRDAITALATSGRRPHIGLINGILTDMQHVLRLHVHPHTHLLILNGLSTNPRASAILKWITSMPKKPGRVRPSLEHWHIYFRHCSKSLHEGRWSEIVQAIRTMIRTGCHPTPETYKFVVQRVFLDPNYGERALKLLDLLSSQDVPVDPCLLSLLSDGIAEKGSVAEAVHFQETYSQRKQAYAFDETLNIQRSVEIVKAGRVGGRSGSTRKYLELAEEGFLPTSSSLAIILGDDYTSADILHWQKTLQVAAHSYMWANLMDKASAENGLFPSTSRVLALYAEALASGIVPDFTLVKPVIRAFCSSSLASPTEAAMDRALQIYSSVKEANPPSEDSAPAVTDISQVVRQHAESKDAMDVYNMLLLALSSSPNKTKYFPKAVSLLEDMRDRRVSENSSTTASTAVLLLRSSATSDEAFQVYKTIRTYTHAPLDVPGYSTVLQTFSKLQFKNEIPAWRAYFEIMRDMREAGFNVYCHVYTDLFRQFANAVANIDSHDMERRQALLHAIRSSHHKLSVDAGMVPDTACWNQLMDTYQRAGSFDDALRVWGMLHLSRQVNNVSISIILDACGYFGAVRTAQRIMETLRKEKYILNAKNWHSWLECLCRVGAFDEAARQLCVEMPKNVDGVQPDVDSARIVMKFAIDYGMDSSIRARIQRFIPEVWEQLPDSLRCPPSQ